MLPVFFFFFLCQSGRFFPRLPHFRLKKKPDHISPKTTIYRIFLKTFRVFSEGVLKSCSNCYFCTSFQNWTFQLTYDHSHELPFTSTLHICQNMLRLRLLELKFFRLPEKFLGKPELSWDRGCDAHPRKNHSECFRVEKCKYISAVKLRKLWMELSLV